MNNKDLFVLYLSNSGLSEKTVENYVNALNSMVSNHIHSFIDEKFDLFQESNSSTMESILAKLLVNPDFANQNKVGKNMYSAAIQKYIQFLNVKLLFYQSSDSVAIKGLENVKDSYTDEELGNILYDYYNSPLTNNKKVALEAFGIKYGRALEQKTVESKNRILNIGNVHPASNPEEITYSNELNVGVGLFKAINEQKYGLSFYSPRKKYINSQENYIYNVLRIEDLKYIKYLAAIKSKPFLLLAGISGTGKSRIVRQLARACDKFDSDPWEVPKPYNYEMISVKPNWHDSTELLGYISRVSGEPHYIVTDFLKFIAKAWMYENIPFFLCLDEMNLAPVEQYFAEFLSVMESRKLINETNVIASDPLLYLSSSSEEEEKMTTNMINDLFSKVECYGNSFEDDGAYHARLESLKEKFKKEGISIPRNLVVIGTVNMDETTYTFSRKVLDRAMTIEMNEVILTDGLNRGKEILPDIAPEWILPDAVEGYDFYDDNTEVCDYVIGYLEKINEKLEGTPFKIAYRTRNDCMLYVVNSLKLCEEAEGLTEDNIRDRALDEVTSMKILSRIEGDKKKVGETLSELERVIKEQFNLTDSDEDRARSVSLKKLKEMNDRLTNTYYCSFWS